MGVLFPDHPAFSAHPCPLREGYTKLRVNDGTISQTKHKNAIASVDDCRIAPK